MAISAIHVPIVPGKVSTATDMLTLLLIVLAICGLRMPLYTWLGIGAWFLVMDVSWYLYDRHKRNQKL